MERKMLTHDKMGRYCTKHKSMHQSIRTKTVSYTHLDVYKRQLYATVIIIVLPLLYYYKT